MEALGRVLEDDLSVSRCRQLPAQLRTADRKTGDALPIEAEDDAALRDGGRVVEVDDRTLRTLDRRVGPLDQLGASLRQDRDRGLGRDQVLLDQGTDEVEVRLRRGREAHLDLRHTEREEKIEEPALASSVHRVDERLVSVPQVGRAPDRGLIEHAIGPGAIRQIDGCVRSVLPVGHAHADGLLRSTSSRTTSAGGDVYVDASLPLPGKDEQAGEELRESCWAHGADADHEATIADRVLTGQGCGA